MPRLGVDLQPFLRESGRPTQLSENADVAYIGSFVMGLGFMVEPDEAANLLRRDPRNAEALLPYVVGADLNRRPDASGSRWIVNFREWGDERARAYTDLWAKLERDVLPERRTKDAKKYPRMVNEWWKFWQYRQGMEATIANLDHVLALSRVGNTLLPLRIPSGPVFSERVVVFALADFSALSLLSSSIHQAWAMRYTSTIRTDIMYAPSDVFLTLPRPEMTPDLEGLGKALDTERRELMLERALGLTKLYNQVHSPSVSDLGVRRLRELHAEIDLAVRDAYGWTDLELDVGHHPTKIGTRWTVSPDARFEILDRLLVENHRRAAMQG